MKKKMKISFLMVLLMMIVSACAPASGALSSGEDGSYSVIIVSSGECIDTVSIGNVSQYGSGYVKYEDARTQENGMFGWAQGVFFDASEQQVNAYLHARTMPEAKNALIALIQDDGTIQPQPASCETAGE